MINEPKEFKVKEEIFTLNGVIYTIVVDGREVQTRLSHHCLERIKRWELNVEKVIETLLFPEEVVTGHGNRFIAHLRVDEHIIRAVYEYENSLPVVITIYYPYSSRYFQGGGHYADNILT